MKLSLIGQVLLASVLLHQIFVVILLLTRREMRKDHSIAMAVFFLANVATNLDVAWEAFVSAPAPDVSQVLGIPSLMLLGPAVYFYARALVSPAAIVVGRRDAWHLAPFACAVCGVLAIAAMQAGEIDTPQPGQWPDARLLAVVAVTFLLIGVFVAATSLYLVWTLRLLLRYRRGKFDYFSSLEGRSLSWFEGMTGLLSVIWLVQLATLVNDLGLHWADVSLDRSAVIEAAWVYPLSFMVLWQQAIFRPLRESSAPAAANPAEPAASGDAGGAPAKYNRSALDEERCRRIEAKLRRAMAEEKLHRRQNLTLRHLSDHTKISENYLSQVLNERIGRNFYEFVNFWRVKDACGLLGDPSVTIIEIGESVGFNSRSTFNAAFKRETGLTPSDYRAKLGAGMTLPLRNGGAAQIAGR